MSCMPTAPYKNMMDCVRQTIRLNGLRGPFQGLGATLLRDTPANSIYLGSFEVRTGLFSEGLLS